MSCSIHERAEVNTMTTATKRKRETTSARQRFWLALPGWTRSLISNKKSAAGLLILGFFFAIALLVPVIAPTAPQRMVGRPHDPPSEKFSFGTTRQGQDVYSQLVYGAGGSLRVGFITGTLVIIIAIAVGVTAGYVGGLVDEVLSLFTNVFLVIGGLPLILVVASLVEDPGPNTIIVVLSITSWSWGARVLRAQTLSLRNSEFVEAARVSGEPLWRIIAVEILPNMTSLVVSSWIGAVLYAILAEAALSFIGIGDPNAITWGTILYWAQNNQALLTGAWWTFIPPGVAISLVGLSLILINYGIDEITNPRLAKS
ncbi:MAG: ABC transporter permease [Chloroflexi bacterium]|nr:ABC transporter permease [Chloroflexota bacterium]MXX50093.1 ABC transporter permease [Chloroflexota bacterium]MXX82566.1 ABC transporter permease [Chloroflexota bacterium]MYA92684.1 ABC transporter permease [Chloroflexota bacterium]MYC55907.1 ABC transporter permease [Chloroflexota bacterium]